MAMDPSTEIPDTTTRLAHWAASFLASSFVLAIAILAIGFWMADSAAWVQSNPLGAALMPACITGYIVAFFCLSRLQKPPVPNPLRAWVVSLLAACIPLAVLAYVFEDGRAALIIGMAEVAAVALHLVAIAIVLSRASTPDKPLERTRGD